MAEKAPIEARSSIDGGLTDYREVFAPVCTDWRGHVQSLRCEMAAIATLPRYTFGCSPIPRYTLSDTPDFEAIDSIDLIHGCAEL